MTPDVLAHLFPVEARFVYMFTVSGEPDLTNYNALHPLERTMVSHAVPNRQAEFGDARWCAHQALKELGAATHIAEAPIYRGERGMPLWPTGYCGSLTHTDGYRAALVAPEGAIRSVGVDVEPAEELPEGILGAIARPGEMAQMTSLEAAGVPYPDRLLFCAKEATYKAWFPLTKRWLGFEQAEIDIRPDGTFISYLLVRPTPVPFINGRWAATDGYLVASTCVRALDERRRQT
ncbi:4'-phosphopantetheinyl transferase family protein [Corynebacterium guangdongense]|uniref:4'-phosphopantetheinyl transferase EntD n=1 Tax=Corynebacterium guangdongense TaxID=1783348 RepID=A0ABU1ZX95_9CORY|nr:4'-phosphopantetheinyl transferase superfamily protein [Corynebacterium guangdongense]MDR7329556.1 4'-phosphopantetheinyl transferase EntD [Corynebacterium guangdongense]WJZ18121.1 4'-phosphopantetheinyl transferase Npt [Corynebacterium guangdongense]